MVIAKQMEIRANIKKYFDMAYDGEPIVVPRKGDKNVIIISESMYSELMAQKRMLSYADKIGGLLSKSTGAGEGTRGDVKAFNINKLMSISALKDGWNGNGAPAFPLELIERVRDLLEHMDIQPEIFPTALSTIQFEFDNSIRDHMEIEIGMEDVSEVFIVRYDGTEVIESIRVTTDDINDRVRAFYG